jgi:hypothetical protein
MKSIHSNKLASTSFVGFYMAIYFMASAAFANRFEFTVDGHEPLYQTTIPIAIYEYTHSNTLSDLTITNAEGEQVPYGLLTYEQLNPQTTEYDKKSLPFYPIQKSSLNNPNELQIQLEKNAGNTKLSISSNKPQLDTNTVFLLNAGTNALAIHSLTAEWQGAEGTFITLEVLGTDDLKTWHTLGSGVLLKSQNDSNSILQNTITLEYPTAYRYLQLKPLEQTAKDSFKLTQVNAIYRHIEYNSKPIHWQTLKNVIRENGAKAGQTNINFEATGHYPACQLHINLPSANTITQVTIATRNATNQPWAILTSDTLYNLNKNNKRLLNPNIVINPTVARYWQLQFNEANGGIGAGCPSLELGWQPHTLVWNARGHVPFTLHVGENPNIVNKVNVANLIPDYKLEKIRQLPTALLTSVAWDNSLKPITTEGNSWENPIDYKRWLLWGGLVLGVLLLAGMAYSLLKTEQKK